MNKVLIERILDQAFGEDQPSLKDQFEERRKELGLSLNQVVDIIGIPKASLTNIFNGKAKTISVTNLIKIGSFIGYETPDEILSNYVSTLSQEVVSELEKVRKAQFIVENFYLPGLKEIGFISQTKHFDVLEKRIKDYFGLQDIFDYNKSIGVAFSKTKRNPNDKMLRFWVSSAYSYLEKINNPNEYDRKRLIDLIPKIRPYTRNVEKGLKIVAQALFQIGVTVVFQPYLPKTQIRGATFLVNGKPCVIITDLHKNYGTLWFALIHELYHVLYDLEAIESMNYHVSEEGKDLMFISEERADEFSREYLFSLQRVKYIKPFIGTELIVKQYAEKAQVHPTIIYSTFAWEMGKKGKNFWPLAAKHSPDVKIALESLNRSIWDRDTIEDAAIELKDTLYSINR